MKDVLMHVEKIWTHREMTVHPGPVEEELLSSLHVNKFKGDKRFDFHTQKPAFADIGSGVKDR